MEVYQGRILYPKRHRRAGQPHPFLYANRGPRTFSHKYFGTQPTGYGLPGGDPRVSGIGGVGGRSIWHAASSVIPRFRFRPSHLQRKIVRRRTTAGHQAHRDMAQQKRDYRKQRSADRRSLRSMRSERRKLEGQIKKAGGIPGTVRWPHRQDQNLTRMQNKFIALNTKRKSFMSEMGSRRTRYQEGRRTTAGRAPMYAAVQKNWGRNVGFRPTGRRPGGGRWGFRNYRGGSLYNRRRGRPSRRLRRRQF